MSGQDAPARTVRFIGMGRAGGSLSAALVGRGWTAAPPVRRTESVALAGHGVDAVIIATPDAQVATVAAAIEPTAAAVIHLAGSLGLDVLAPHERAGALHPLVALPNAVVGAERLTAGAWFGIAGDPITREICAALSGRWFEVADDQRAVYHAAAVVASNHVVALLGQVERLASAAEVPLEAYLDLVRGSVENVATLGARQALTGPVARGDDATLDRHRAAVDPSEIDLYDELVRAARRLLHD